MVELDRPERTGRRNGATFDRLDAREIGWSCLSMEVRWTQTSLGRPRVAMDPQPFSERRNRRPPTLREVWGLRRAQRCWTHRTAHGRTSRRSWGIGSPHSSHRPYSPLAKRDRARRISSNMASSCSWVETAARRSTAIEVPSPTRLPKEIEPESSIDEVSSASSNCSRSSRSASTRSMSSSMRPS